MTLKEQLKARQEDVAFLNKELKRVNDYLLAYEAENTQLGLKNEHFKTKIAEALSWIHEGKAGNAIQILNHLL